MVVVLAVVALVAALVLSAMAAAALTAIRATSRPHARELEAEGRPGATRLAALLGDPGKPAAILRLVVLGGRCVAAGIAAVLGERWADGWGAALGVGLVVLVAFTLGEVVPATVGARHADGVALRAARPVSALLLAAPVRGLLRLLLAISSLFLGRRGVQGGPYARGDDTPAEPDIDQLEEEELLHSLTEFGETVLHQVMVPRTDMTVLPCDLNVSDALDVMIAEGYSRLPCVDDNVDRIQGLVILKDLVRASRSGDGQADLRTLMRPAVFVPEQKRVAELLREMQRSKFHMAVVVDEYGGTAGLVTLEDLLEELVGEIADEFDDEEQLFEMLGNRTARVAGRMAVTEVNELLGVDFPDTEWDTIGGFVLHLIGRVPEVGESRVHDGVRLTVERVQGRRIVAVRITLPPEARRGDASDGARRAG